MEGCGKKSHFLVFFSSMSLVPAYLLEDMVAVFAEAFLERSQRLGCSGWACRGGLEV